MTLRRLLVTASLGAIIWGAAPATASAEWMFTPFIGTTFGGSADVAGGGASVASDFERQVNFGASLMSGGTVGFELDFGYSPNFFNDAVDEEGFTFTGDGNVTTLMANLKIGASGGPVRPYFVVGGGLIKSRVDDAGQFLTEISSNDFGFDIGGGINAFFSDAVGVRGDLRFFRSVQDTDPDGIDLTLGSFKFWRATAGVTFKF